MGDSLADQGKASQALHLDAGAGALPACTVKPTPEPRPAFTALFVEYTMRQNAMLSKPLDRLLAELEAARTEFAPGTGARVVALLAELERREIPDIACLIRYHETLLFLRAFPHNLSVVRQSERALNKFIGRVERLRSAGVDLSPLDPLEVSGITGTTIEDTLSFDVVRWLARRFPRQVEIVWDGSEQERLMANTWPRFLPLLEEDADVEASIPWRDWLRAARGRESELEWLLRLFERLALPPRQNSELYDGLQIIVRWRLDNLRASRTRNWRRPARFYFHRAALLRRADVSLADELAASPPPLTHPSRQQGGAVLDLVREVMAVRYRELYGTTLGDPRQVVRAQPGRGIEMYLWGLPPERRLPLRAYLAGMTVKNGVPINYIEAITLFEWTEIGFNTFYTFRDGETAWVYAQALRMIRQLHRVRCISVYPYQIGKDNKEAIESGAFWFYRKLGFRPGRPELVRLTEAEERKIASRPGYRTSSRTLRRLADGHIFYELPDAEKGAWDRFSARKIGLKVNQKMSDEFDGDADRFRAASAARAARILGVQAEAFRGAALKALEDFSLVLELIPDLPRWSSQEKGMLARIIRAKAGANETEYVRLLQSHARLRAAMLKLGS